MLLVTVIVNLNNIEEVDYIWQGESYSDLTGKSKCYDWIIASHVIEHTPDLVGFLNDCETLLKDDGVISLVIPDKRYCFDHFRPVTGLARVVDSYFNKNTIHTPGEVAEYYLNVVSKNGVIAWDVSVDGEYELVHTLSEATHGMELVRNDDVYIDVHGWCFVPHSFRLMIHDLNSLGLISLKEVDFYSTVGHEFYMTLGKSGVGLSAARLDVLKAIDEEINEGFELSKTPAPVKTECGYNFKKSARSFLNIIGLK